MNLETLRSQPRSVVFDFILKDINPPDFQEWTEDGYNRVVVSEDEVSEVVLCFWKPGDTSPIHFHDGKDCFYKVLKGQITEELFIENEAGDFIPVAKGNINEGQSRSIDDNSGAHKISCSSDIKTVSLHFYSKPVS